MSTAKDLVLEQIAQKAFRDERWFEDKSVIYSFDRIEEGYFIFKTLKKTINPREKRYSLDSLQNLQVADPIKVNLALKDEEPIYNQYTDQDIVLNALRGK